MALEARSVSEGSSDHCPKILVVDDEQEILDCMVEWLSRAGYQVLSAPTGQEALRIFTAEHPELLITDLSMPGMNGLDLAKAVKAISPETEVLMLVAHCNAACAAGALHRGIFDDYLTKPLNIAELEWGIKRRLEHSRLVEENRTLVEKLEEQRQITMRWKDCNGSRGCQDLEILRAPLASRVGALLEVVEQIKVTEHRGTAEGPLAPRARDDAMQLLGRLAGGVAHDFNNQLTVIKGCVQFLLEAMPASDPHRREAERISDAVDRGARLVRQLLAFSRTQDVDPRSLNLAELVDEMVPLLRALLGEQIFLRAHAAPGLWRVHADRAQIEQVILTLVASASDAMAIPGALTVEMANVELDEAASRPFGETIVPGPYLMLAVNRVAPEVQRQVLEPACAGPARAPAGGHLSAAQAGADRPACAGHADRPFFRIKAAGKGTSLEISRIFHFVKQHRGYLVCENEPGQGVSFRIYLPRAEEWEEAPAEGSIAPTACLIEESMIGAISPKGDG